MRLRPLDFAAIIVAIAAIALASISAYSRKGAEVEVVISGDSGEWIYPIGEDRRVEVSGPLGSTWIEIRDRAVRIEDSPCPNKSCVASGSIAASGQWLACLPNKVFVRIEGREAEGEVDASSF